VRRIAARLFGLRLLRAPPETWIPLPSPEFRIDARGIGPARWLNGQSAHWVIGRDVDLVASLPARRFTRLVLGLAPQMLSDPPQAVLVELNGVVLGKRALGREPAHYAFSLSAGSTKVGRNHLRLVFDRAFPLSDAAPDSPTLAATLSLVTFSP
jgi:hypothetical protein